MIKINFKNGASGKTPLNATNLNKMQDNVETAINEADLIKRINIEGNSIQEGTPSIDSEAPIESVGDNINLFNIETVTVNTYINHETGKTATSGSSITSDYIEIKANESITIIYDYEALQNTSNRGIAFYNENKTFLSGTTYTSTKKETTIIPNQNGYMRFCYDNNCTNVKVVKGTKATTYSPYGQGSIGITLGNGTTSQTKALYTQQPFRAIGDIKDRFVKQNGVWHEEHNVERIVFDGTQEFSAGAFGINTYQYYKLGISPISDSKILTSSNYFKGVTIADRASTDNYLVYLAQNYIYFRNTEFATVDKFKANLTELYNAGTPLYVDYVLTEPLLIPCTPEQVEVLSDIHSDYGKGITNITCTDEVAPVIEIVKETKETVQSENDKAIATLLARIEELEKKVK